MRDFPANWDVTSAEDFCSSVRDGTHDSPKFVDHGYPLVTSKNIKGGSIDLGTAALISATDFEEINKRSKVDQWDVLFSMIGTVGEVCLVDSPHVEFAIKNVGLFKCKSEEDGRWLALWLRSDGASSYVSERLRGASQQYIPLGELRKLPVPVPRRDGEKRRICSILSAYDDLIATNQRRIALLEDAARRLYREWFVYLRFPGHDSVPVNDGCPNGWRTGQLGDACHSLEDGDWIESKDQGGQDFRLIQVSNIGVGCFMETGAQRYITEDVFRRLRCREVVPGDILISRMPAPIGRAWLVQAMPWRMITAVDVAIAKPASDVVDPAFLLLHLNSEENMRLSGQQTSGATRPRISRKQLAALPIRLPPLALQVRFAAVIGPGLETIDTLRRQNEELARARDLLLPKLMSGQLDVSGIRLPDEGAA